MKLKSVRTTLFLGILILLVMAIVAWMFVLQPRLQTASEINAQTDQVAAANTTLQARLNNTMRDAQAAPQKAAEAQALFKTFPQEAELDTVLDSISAAATQAGLPPGGLTNVRTGVPVPVAPTDAAVPGLLVAQISMDITAKGTKQELLDFLTNLEKLERVLLIQGTTLTESQETKDANLTVRGSMFILQSDLPDLVAQVDELLAKAGTPAAPAAGAAASPAATPAQ